MIDRDRLREMEADFGAEELALIVAAFLEEASTAIARLRIGWSDEAVRRDRLHFLKGCARTIGASRLGALCEELEGRTAAPEDLRALESEFALLREALDPGRLLEAG